MNKIAAVGLISLSVLAIGATLYGTRPVDKSCNSEEEEVQVVDQLRIICGNSADGTLVMYIHSRDSDKIKDVSLYEIEGYDAFTVSMYTGVIDELWMGTLNDDGLSGSHVGEDETVFDRMKPELDVMLKALDR